MHLYDLSTDALALILRGSLSPSVLALWKTGCRQLQSKLCNGGVRELEFCVDSITMWPQCLKSLHLQSFSLTATSIKIHNLIGPGLRAELRQLWHGLETLEIVGDEVVKAFALEKLAPNRKRITHAPRGATKRAKVAEEAEIDPEEALFGNWDMNLTHPRMTRLKIGATSTSKKGIHPRLIIGNLGFLPRSLTSLDMSQTYLELTNQDCHRLPPQLTTLILPSYDHFPPVINKGNMPYLPSSLTYIDTVNKDYRCFTLPGVIALAESDGKLLPNLVSFPIPKASPASLHSTFLKGGGLWPQNVSFLSIGRPEGSFAFTSILATPLPPKALYMPPQLTSLFMTRVDWTGLGTQMAPGFWPPTLTTLTLEDSYLAPQYYWLLPRNLKTLFGDLPRLHNVSNHFGYPQLEEPLRATGVRLLAQEKNLWKSIRQELIEHVETCAGHYGREQLDEYFSAVESGGLFGLPLGLEELWFGQSGRLQLGILPPLVKRCTVKSEHWTKEYTHPALPPLLREFTVGLSPFSDKFLPALRRSNVIYLEAAGADLKVLLPFLPPGLVQLRLGLCVGLISASSIAGLPKGLSALRVYRNVGISADSNWAPLPCLDGLQHPTITPEEPWGVPKQFRIWHGMGYG